MIEFLLFFIIGFLAQLVDGALGMAYGIISMSILLSIGIPPSAASAGVHTAEIFTTGISGFSHAMFKNIDYLLFRRLILPGIIGSILGAYFLTRIPVEIIKPIISIYLFLMGVIILYRAVNKLHWLDKVTLLINKALGREKLTHRLSRLVPLGLTGGFCDAIGGGGWGSIVVSSLLAQEEDNEPQYVIGTTSLAEFLVALSSSTTFFILIGISHWRIVLGLILGGAIAAPLAAFTVKYISAKVLMLFAGIIVILISIRTVIVLFL